MADHEKLPTLGEAISNWLGVQLPSIPLPQTLRNLDKAIGKIVLASGENLEAKIRANAGRAKTKGKIEIEGMFRTEEERRKLENKSAATQAAIEEIEANPDAEDAQQEIEEDWLNLFARLAEDKSSEELRRLLGKVLAGEIKKPGSFSLRTVQLLATLSKRDADLISKFLSYAVGGVIVPFCESVKSDIPDGLRLTMDELGIANHPTQIGGMSWTVSVQPQTTHFMKITSLGLVIENKTTAMQTFKVPGQVLTSSARELIPIANPPPVKIEYVKEVGRKIYLDLKASGRAEQLDAGQIVVRVVTYIRVSKDTIRYEIVDTISEPTTS